MGLFEGLFGKKKQDLTPASGKRPGPGVPTEFPPDVARACELQRTYWTHNAAELARLQARGFAQLAWPERLRLHHLLCLARQASEHGDALESACRESAARLLAPESPYRARPAMVWQGRSVQPGAQREPDLQGEFCNPSLTHLGCLEIFRVDGSMHAQSLDFVPFDDLATIAFASPTLLRGAKLFYFDGRHEIVLAPLLYGLTWSIGAEYERAGTMTRFENHLGEVAGALGPMGIGVGQQDFSLRSEQGVTLFGLGSVMLIEFPLDMRDLRFDEKARAAGIDPSRVRRDVGNG